MVKGDLTDLYTFSSSAEEVVYKWKNQMDIFKLRNEKESIFHTI